MKAIDFKNLPPEHIDTFRQNVLQLALDPNFEFSDSSEEIDAIQQRVDIVSAMYSAEQKGFEFYRSSSDTWTNVYETGTNVAFYLPANEFRALLELIKEAGHMYVVRKDSVPISELEEKPEEEKPEEEKVAPQPAGMQEDTDATAAKAEPIDDFDDLF